MNNTLKPPKPILIVGRDKEELKTIQRILKENSINNLRFTLKPEKTIQILQKMEIPCLVWDFKSQEDLEIVKKIKEKNHKKPVIAIVNNNHYVKEEFFRYITFLVRKSDISTGLNFAVKKALMMQDTLEENERLKETFSKKEVDLSSFSDIKTKNEEMISMFKYLKAVAKTSELIFLVGETGTGKCYLAEAIHRESEASGSFISIRPNELNESSVQRHFFGERLSDGTMANGIVQEADGGTIYIKEIDKVNLKTQDLLNSFIVDKQYFPVNSSKSYLANVKIIVSAREDLRSKVKNGNFRESLYYKLKGAQVNIPPLRDRISDDLLLLVNTILNEKSSEINKEKPIIEERVLDLLESYSFPGNVEELISMLTGALLRNGDEERFYQALKKFINNSDGKLIEKPSEEKVSDEDHKIYIKGSRMPTLDEVNKETINIALDRAGNRIPVAANFLGITKEKLHELLIKYKIDVKGSINEEEHEQ